MWSSFSVSLPCSSSFSHTHSSLFCGSKPMSWLGPFLTTHTQRGFIKAGPEVSAATLSACASSAFTSALKAGCVNFSSFQVVWNRDADTTLQGPQSPGYPAGPHPDGCQPGRYGQPRWGDVRVIIAAWGWDISSTLWGGKWTHRLEQVTSNWDWVCE